MATRIGSYERYRKIKSFDETQEKWEMWNDIAKNIDEDHQVPTLLSLIGGKTYILLRDLLTTKKQLRRASRISSQPLNITHNTSPKPLLAERFRFSKTKLAWRRNCDYLLGRSEEASGPLQFWKKSINKKNYQAWREIMWATWQPEQKCYLGRFTSREETAEKMKLDTSSGEDEEM